MVWLSDHFRPGEQMNTISDDHDGVDPEVWDWPEMRAALAERDITRVYRLLQKFGFSQQRIAALAGQSQPEVSAIIHGRKVMAYDVLSRVADGLGIPRGYMGLAYAVEPSQRPPTSTAPMGVAGGVVPAGAGSRAISAGAACGARESEEDGPVQRRDFLGAAAAVAVGGHVPAVERWLPRPVGPVGPTPTRIGAADIAQIRAATHQHHELALQLGGGASADAVTGYLRWASGYLRSRYSDDTGRELRVALADLHGVAGTSLHDSGRHLEANRHFMQGLVLAREVSDHAQAASLLSSMGWVSLEQEHAADALRFFQLAHLAAEDAGSHAELALLHAREAWAYALLGQPNLVADALARADDERGRVVASEEQVTFHGAAQFEASHANDALACVAFAHWLLARADIPAAARSAELAVDGSTRVLAADNLPGRLLALRQVTLAGAMLCAGERETGLAAAHEAVDRVAAVRSVRATDRLRHVATAAKAWPRHRPAIDLRRRIATLQGA
jgi:tetratricopeptide (TPR) repeat protein